MNANGFVVAISERMRFYSEKGMLLKIYNEYMNISFHIFVQVELLLSWENLLVNCKYIFQKLKIYSLKVCEDFRKIVFKATFESSFVEQKNEKCFQFNVPLRILKALSHTGAPFSFNNEINSNLYLISYEGLVTNVKNTTFGIYELDRKILLYTTFIKTPFNSNLKENCKVYISNVHLISGYQEMNLLVCCGLSSLKILEPLNHMGEENFELCRITYLVQKYSLSIFDILWLKELLTRLDSKFLSLIFDDPPFSWDFDSFDNILKLFVCSKCLHSINESNVRSSLPDEFLSYPHSCIAFSQHILNQGCFVPFIPDIITEAETRITWEQKSKNWRFSVVSSAKSSVLFGMLFMFDGTFYFGDNQDFIPCVFVNDDEDSGNILCDFKNPNTGLIIALKEYTIIFEEILNNNSICSHVSYLCISNSSVSPITSFCIKPDLFLHANLRKTFHKQPKNVTEKTYIGDSCCRTDNDMTMKICDDIQEMKKHSSFQNSDTNSNFVHNKNILVISKLWSFFKAQLICCNALVILIEDLADLQEPVVDSYISYTEDDFEFAQLINRMEGLTFTNKTRHLLLRFGVEFAGECALLQTGHVYDISYAECASIQSENKLCDIEDLMYSGDLNIHHSSDCKGSFSSENYGVIDYVNVQSVLAKRNIPKNAIVRGVVTEKFYEQDYSSSPNGEFRGIKQKKMTLCLGLQDAIGEESIRVYLTHCPPHLYGILLGTAVELFGFLCICSQKGYLYLKPSRLFGIEIKGWNNPCKNIRSIDFKPSAEQISSAKIIRLENLEKNNFNAVIKCLCHILKIISVEIFLGCQICNLHIADKCRCHSPYTVKAKASFLIDDGTDQIFIHCDEETVRKVLKVKECEWKQLRSFTKDTKQSLKYYNKMDACEFSSLSYMNQVFHVLCSNRQLFRKVVLFCYSRKEKGNSQCSWWCIDAEEVKTKELMMNLYSELLHDKKDISSLRRNEKL